MLWPGSFVANSGCGRAYPTECLRPKTGDADSWRWFLRSSSNLLAEQRPEE